MSEPAHRNLGLAASSLVAATGTLVCCVLPAVMVALGAGAVLASWVTAVHALVWLSAHKALVFAVAFTLLGVSGVALWRGRLQPCPADAALAAACTRLRRASLWLWIASAVACLLGVLFAFVLPALL